ncbi:CAAX amino terminal protease self- immunity [Planctomycetes bacterium MalM25]|nr:CAAX amino terminal protease self- immunity [Planctomycetes bacterium MalM25]
MWLMVTLAVAGALVVTAWVGIGIRWSHGEPAVARRPRRRVPWAADGAALAGLFLLGAAMTLSLNTQPQTAVESRGSGLTLWQAAAHGFMLLVFSTVVVGWIITNYTVRKVRLPDFGLASPLSRWFRDILLGVLACGAMLPIVYTVNASVIALLGQPSVHPAIESLLNEPQAETVLSAALLAVVLAPVFEELAFRVLLQGWLEKRWRRGAWAPIVISAIAFGLAHTNQGYAPIPIIVLALGMGYVYRQTHSYPAVVAMHATFNSLSLAVAIGMGPLLPR